MENEKNNAIEKVENLSTDTASSSAAQGAPKGKASAKKTAKAKTAPSVSDSLKAEIKREEERVENTQKEITRHEKRVKAAIERRKKNQEKLKAKERRLSNRQKALKARKTAIKNRREEYKAEKLRAKEERLARRDMLKHESKAEREKRIAAEKQAKMNAKLEANKRRHVLREKRSDMLKQKRANKQALRQQRQAAHHQDKDKKRARGIGGWLAAVISLGSTTLVLATLFTLSLINNSGVSFMGSTAVAETYYDLVDYVDNLEVNMSKLLVSNDKSQQQRLLGEISTHASLAANDLAQLPLKDEAKYYTTKYINQVADYSKYLVNKLIDGDLLSKTDKENLSQLYKINTTLKEELSALNTQMGVDFDFNNLLNDGKDNPVLEKFTQLEANAVEYPKLIYDGPFSDSLDKKVPKAITGEEITTRQAEELFESIFAKHGIKNIESTGESHGKIDCYNVEADFDGGKIFASISKKGGKLVMFNNYLDCTAQNKNLDECVNVGYDFLSTLGINNVTAVWATESGATAYINYCVEQEGVILYPDMIKLTVCKERGVVSGMDGVSYYLNHTARDIKEPTISQQTALDSLSTDLVVDSVRLSLIPRGENKEALAYEVAGTFNGATYYVYIDAATGKEAQIFRVVDTVEGQLLM
ncbi:MAG: germination protein YpeB [Clostridia bacterium]|nr:germination protein YpeB [Clostridia bacterium]